MRTPSRQSRWRSRNPLAYWAHCALQSALRRGLVKRLPCQRCDAEGAHGHHDDYRRPIDVVGLCPKCHAAAHGRGTYGRG